MDPMDDLKLNQLLREWRLPGAPQSLDERVLPQRESWWARLLTGSVRLPIPVFAALIAILLAMCGALLSRSPSRPPARTVNLIDFQPVHDLNIRVIRSRYEQK